MADGLKPITVGESEILAVDLFTRLCAAPRMCSDNSCVEIAGTFIREIANRRTPSPRVALLERVAEIAAKVQSGAKEAYRPHGAIICHIAHAPLADALNEQEKALAALNAAPEEK